MIHPRFQHILKAQQAKQEAECRYINRATRAANESANHTNQAFRARPEGPNHAATGAGDKPGV